MTSQEDGPSTTRGDWSRGPPDSITDELERLAGSSPHPLVALVGPMHLVAYANAAFGRFLGRPASALVGLELPAALPEPHRDAVLALVENVRRTRHPGHVVDIMSAEDGRAARWWSYSAWGVQTADREDGRLLLQVVDTTGRVPERDDMTGSVSDLLDANRRLLVASIEAQDSAAVEAESSAAVRSLADLLRAVLDASPDPILLADGATGLVEFANRGWEALGFEPPRLRGMPLVRLLSDAATVLARGEDTSAMMTTLLDRSGAGIAVELRVGTISDQDRTRLVLSARDVRDRLRTEARLLELADTARLRAAELEATIEAMRDAVAVLDGSGNVRVTNAAMKQVLADRPVSEAAIRAALGGAALPLPDEAALLQHDGRWLDVRTFATPHANEETARSIVVVIRDVTREIAADEARDAFIGVLSHEIRTPITTILGFSELLARSVSVEPSIARDIAAEAERLHRLTEDLLVLSRTEHDRLDIDHEPVLVQRMVQSAVALEAPRFPQARFVADMPNLPPVWAEPAYVEQILRNLLSNAGKYGPDGPCEIRVEADSDSNSVSVRVLDEGPGFESGGAERLFGLYYREGTSARRASGAGIGLFVARALVRAMGGRIWAAPRDGGGSEFGFDLPRARSSIDEDEGL